MPRRLTPDLIRAYEASEYHVEDPEGAFILRIGEYSPPLERCQARYRVRSSAFITAWNPHSEPHSTQANQAAQRHLIESVEGLGLVWIPGCGKATDSSWPPEPAILVPGIRRTEAVALGKRYRQNAIVFCGEAAVPELEIIL